MHPWSTERAKIAAESEISPPISPKQHAVVGGPQGDDFLEPSLYYQRQLSGVIALNSPPLEPISTGLLLTRSDSSSSSSGSVSSSSTSLSSVSRSSSTHQHYSTSPTLQKLDVERKPTELYLIDTPPSSHVTSPSSPPFPALKEPLPLNSTGDLSLLNNTSSTTANTTTAASAVASVRPKTRAPYHCTKKSVPQIIREISDLVDGRDKTIKVVQYFAKVILWLFLSNPKQYEILATRLKALAKQFSNTRKVLRLTHFIDPLASVLTLAVTLRATLQKHGLRGTLAKSPSQTWRNATRDRLESLNSLIGFVQDIADDIYCLGVIGVLDRSFSDKAEPWSNRLWMAGVTIDLHENYQSIRDVKKQIQALELKAIEGHKSEEEEKAWTAQHVKLTTKLHWLKVTTVKLGGDFLFCAYDNLHCSFSDGFQAVTGFASGLAGAYKFVGKVMES
ncbi:hypothetical protein BGX26_009255 [Mortierella sp. AD094]|nr:hypothetical protein BGX26_009255 [Mortierella sp. AD094]